MSIHDHPYGVGLAYRNHLHEEVMHYASEIDLLEIPTEDHIIRHRALGYPQAAERFAEAKEAFPCVAHGISLSLGSVQPLDAQHVKMTNRFLEESGISIFSEHLAFQCMDGIDISCFLQMPFDDVSLDWLVQNYNHARSQFGRPIALENVSFSFPVPGGTYSEPEFLAEFLNRTDATLLLDVTNLYNNATNYKFDPIEYLHTLPPDRISQMHLAGGHYDDAGFLIDSHSYSVMEEVWDLYRECLKYTDTNIVILERDYMCFPFREVMTDMQKAREIFYELRPDTAPTNGVSPNGNGQNGSATEAPTPNFEDAHFADLRAFQRTLIKAIDDDDFRAACVQDPNHAATVFPMEQAWIDRYAACEKLESMAEGWKETDRLNKEDLERFRKWEWGQWAQQIEPAPAE